MLKIGPVVILVGGEAKYYRLFQWPSLGQDILSRLNDLKHQGEILRMALSAAELALIERFNTATNAIAAKINDLINNRPEDDEDFNAQLRDLAAGLEALGAGGTPPVDDPSIP